MELPIADRELTLLGLCHQKIKERGVGLVGRIGHVDQSAAEPRLFSPDDAAESQKLSLAGINLRFVAAIDTAVRQQLQTTFKSTDFFGG